MGRRGRRREVKTRRPKAIDGALCITILWGAMVIFFFGGGGVGRANPTYVLIFGGLAIGAWAWAIQTIRAKQASGKTLEQLQALSPDVFEDWVAARFRDLGYSIKITGTHGDHGVDLVAEKSGETAIIQCKNYKSWSVGEPVLRDLFGAMHDFGASSAYLVTSGKLTQSATKWMAGKPIEVWDGDYLACLSTRLAEKGGQMAGSDAKPNIVIVDQPGTSVTPVDDIGAKSVQNSEATCPKCRSLLVKKRNRHTEELFLACPKYPACRHTQPLVAKDEATSSR